MSSSYAMHQQVVMYDTRKSCKRASRLLKHIIVFVNCSYFDVFTCTGKVTLCCILPYVTINLYTFSSSENALRHSLSFFLGSVCIYEMISHILDHII